MKNAVKSNPDKKKINIFSAFIRLFASHFKSVPILYTVSIIVGILHGAFFGVETMMQQRFFDSAEAMIRGSNTFEMVIISLLLLGATNITCQVLNGVGNFIPDTMNKKSIRVLSSNLHKKASRLSPSVFEDTERLDDINKAEEGMKKSFWFVFAIEGIFGFYLPYFLFMGWFLFSLQPILAAAIIIVFIPTAATQIIRARFFTNLEDKSAPVRRENDYYDKCITSREYFKETRLLGGFSYFKKLYLESLDILQKLRLKATTKSNLFELSARVLTVLGYFGILMLLFFALMNNEITVGAFAAVFNSIGMLYTIMEEIVCRHLGGVAKDLGSIKNYLNFLDMDERKGTVYTAPEWGDIVLDKVTFAYPKAERNAVSDVSFTLKKGETIAIVGENGSGKSTLIRLISGLYLPTDGKVTHSNVDTKDLTSEALFENTSAVFQKYQRYQMLLDENITISSADKIYDEELLDSICEQAGTDKDDSSFTDGYKTMLSREFDGVDLSGGQWQRVAIARGFFRNHNLIILDEPTAAIDPYEETRIYNRFAEISRNKTAVIVTHRLGSVKLADRIVVMKDSRVSQIGTHDELIAVEGEYQRLYVSQEQWYKE